MYRTAFLLALLVLAPTLVAAQSLADWAREFPKTDFSQRSVNFRDIQFDGARRDTIPPVTKPVYGRVAEMKRMGDEEPLISVVINSEARAYPLAIMLWHEIVNETIGGVPVLISYCPLCNSAVVYDRRVNGKILSFGNTGRIRHRDMVMYDHETESWWQQFSGRAIIGSLTGQQMTALPARVESLARFRARAPDGLVLLPENPRARRYGTTPYEGMDNRRAPRLLQRYPVPGGLRAFSYVVVAEGAAWPLERLREQGTVSERGLILSWTPGRNSIHDSAAIAQGRDIGNVVVRRAGGQKNEVPHDVVFAFSFAAFLPDGIWMLGSDDG